MIGYVIWARQIEAQLMAYMKRVEDVLGPDWEKQPDGAKLKQESDGFRAKLNTDHVKLL
jgi:dynein heavy chain 1